MCLMGALVFNMCFERMKDHVESYFIVLHFKRL